MVRDVDGLMSTSCSPNGDPAALSATRNRAPVLASAPDHASAAVIRWSVVLAYYNEAEGIQDTLHHLVGQTRPFRLILVDNGSSDASTRMCHQALRGTGIDYCVLHEDFPGQTAAFARGLREVATEFVATCDADTIYPSAYLAEAERLFDEGGPATVAASAYFLAPHDLESWRALLMAAHQRLAGMLLTKQTHVGAAGQCFRTRILRAAGGYSPQRWPFVLGDHEVMHQVMKHGRQAMAWGHWCAPSQRRSSAIRWSLLERVAYHATPFALKDRYFRWLGLRFAARGMLSRRLRTRDWESASA